MYSFNEQIKRKGELRGIAASPFCLKCCLNVCLAEPYFLDANALKVQ